MALIVLAAVGLNVRRIASGGAPVNRAAAVPSLAKES